MAVFGNPFLICCVAAVALTELGWKRSSGGGPPPGGGIPAGMSPSLSVWILKCAAAPGHGAVSLAVLSPSSSLNHPLGRPGIGPSDGGGPPGGDGPPGGGGGCPPGGSPPSGGNPGADVGTTGGSTGRGGRPGADDGPPGPPPPGGGGGDVPLGTAVLMPKILASRAQFGCLASEELTRCCSSLVVTK